MNGLFFWKQLRVNPGGALEHPVNVGLEEMPSALFCRAERWEAFNRDPPVGEGHYAQYQGRFGELLKSSIAAQRLSQRIQIRTQSLEIAVDLLGRQGLQKDRALEFQLDIVSLVHLLAAADRRHG